MALRNFLEEFRSNEHCKRDPRIEFSFEEELNRALSHMPNRLRLIFLTVLIKNWLNEDDAALAGVFSDPTFPTGGEPLLCFESPKGNILDFCWRHPKEFDTHGVPYEDEGLIFSIQGSGRTISRYREALIGKEERKNPLILPSGSAMYLCWDKD